MSNSRSAHEYEAETARLNKIISVLVQRAEQGINSDSSDFSLFQTTIALEEKVRNRTTELKRALDNLAVTNEELDRSLHELKQTQVQLIEAEKMAALGSLVAGVAHEINTPVGVAYTTLSFINDSSQLFKQAFIQGQLRQSTVEGFLADLDDGCKLALKSLENARDLIIRFKQIAVSSEDEKPSQVNLYEVLLDLATVINASNVDIDFRIFIDCDEDLVVTINAGALNLALSQLINNSLLHGSSIPGHATIQVSLSVTLANNKLIVECSDNGPGLPPEIVNHLFEPFHTTARGSGGTGLGLHIVYNLVTQVLRGSVDYAYKQGVGPLFTLTLPAE